MILVLTFDDEFLRSDVCYGVVSYVLELWSLIYVKDEYVSGFDGGSEVGSGC